MVCTHCNACNVDVTVSHGNHSEIFLSYFLSAGSELSRLAELGSLGSLTAGVRLNFGVENEDVDVFAACENVVKNGGLAGKLLGKSFLRTFVSIRIRFKLFV